MKFETIDLPLCPHCKGTGHAVQRANLRKETIDGIAVMMSFTGILAFFLSLGLLGNFFLSVAIGMIVFFLYGVFDFHREKKKAGIS